MPSADVLAQIAAIIVAATGLYTAITAARVKHRIDQTHDVATTVDAKVTTENGSTLGQNSDAVRSVVAPKPEDVTPSTGA